jgi:hypothetical protein
MRAIEAEINHRRDEVERRSDIPLTNFRGIELRPFPAEIARLALIIAEYQCDVNYRGRQEALAEFLPLDSQNWIIQGNALQLDWLSVCEPTGRGGGKIYADDLFGAPLDQAKIDFENEGGETYICGNPPYLGSQWQTKEQKDDLGRICDGRIKNWKSLDYVAGWFLKAADFGKHNRASAALVATNSICQGRQVETLWTEVFGSGAVINFAHTSFKWANLASHNAGVTVVIVGIAQDGGASKRLFDEVEGQTVTRQTDNISPYLVSGPSIIVQPSSRPLNGLPEMSFGNMPNEGSNLLLTAGEAEVAIAGHTVDARWIRRFIGSQEFIRGTERRCIWVTREDFQIADQNPWLHERFESVRELRSASSRATTNELAAFPYRFGEVRQSGNERTIVVPRVSSESRQFLPVGVANTGTIIGDRNFALYDAPLWNMALIASRLHWVWIGTVCVRLEMRFSYSNTLGWNTFPVPPLTEQNKADLTRCAEDILLAREAHFPSTIADLYEVKDGESKMPEDLREAHERNDEVLERIYIGRRFRNDTERLEKLFELYTKMTAKGKAA